MGILEVRKQKFRVDFVLEQLERTRYVVADDEVEAIARIRIAYPLSKEHRVTISS